MKVPPLAVVAALLLAGCTSGGGGGESGPEVGTDPTEITDPRNFTDDQRPHVHNYWAGRTSIVILEQEVSGGLAEDGTPTMHPEPGTTVIPGTRWVNVTVDFTAEAFMGREVTVEVRYQHANTTGDATRWSPWSELRPGETLVINTTEQMNDQPHTTTSRWAFQIKGLNATDWDGTIRITAERGPGPLPVAPPHPDHWGNASRIRIAEAEGDLFDSPTPNAGGEPNHRPSMGIPSIVPPRTGEVRMVFAYNNSGPDALAYDPVMRYHGAETREHSEWMPPDVDEPGRFEWRMAAEPDMWDSPYMNRTQWDFDVAWTGNPPTTGYMDGDYHWWIDVYREEA